MKKFGFLFVFLAFCSACSDDDPPLEPIDNEYSLDGETYAIASEMYWELKGGGEVDEIRLLEPLLASDNDNLLVLRPNTGPSSVEGTYVYSQTGDVGTYDLVFVYNTDGQAYSWLTNGESGAVLEIIKVGQSNGQNIYRVLVEDFVLNYGSWDYLSGKWVSQGTKEFSLSYEGRILEE